MITSQIKLCIGIGFPIQKSLGPIIHNSGLESLNLHNDFTYISMNIAPEKLDKFLDVVKTSNVRGITVTLPHKQAVLTSLDKIDQTAKDIGAVNTIVNNEGFLTGYNTDWIGAVEPLQNILSLTGKKVAIIGAGGAARAFAYGLTKSGADVTIFNRTISKADELANLFGCKSENLDNIHLVQDFDVICNASSVGFSGSEQATLSPVPKEFLNQNHTVFDAVYSPIKTTLLNDAESVGAKTIPGTKMLLHQAYAQFELYYEKSAPAEVMESKLMEYLKNEQ